MYGKFRHLSYIHSMLLVSKLGSAIVGDGRGPGTKLENVHPCTYTHDLDGVMVCG